MFQINDYVIYGENGVCKISDICTPPITGIDKNTIYYIMHPLNSLNQTIYTPVDSSKRNMRRILTEKEAKELISKISSIESVWIDNEKFRDETFKKAIRTNDCMEWVKIIKTLYMRKEERKAERKAISSTDEKYYKAAEAFLYDELSIALGIPAEQMEQHILQQVNEKIL